jgi:hypothetical protein
MSWKIVRGPFSNLTPPPTSSSLPFPGERRGLLFTGWEAALSTPSSVLLQGLGEGRKGVDG